MLSIASVRHISIDVHPLTKNDMWSVKKMWKLGVVMALDAINQGGVLRSAALVTSDQGRGCWNAKRVGVL